MSDIVSGGSLSQAGALHQAGVFYQEGKLEDAIVSANAAVRAAPAELAPRILLAELLLFDGRLERADVILDMASSIDPAAALVVAEFRQLLRAETARRQLQSDGRLPEFLGEPTPALQAALAVRVAWRAGDAHAAAEHAAEAETLRPRIAGRHETAAFEDLRDACDLHIGFIEVLTTTGKYFWIPTERIETAEFHPPQRPRDLYWRRVTMSVKDGPEGDIYVPALYAVADIQDSLLKLGRATDWIERSGLVFGVGQRTCLVGEEALTLQAIASLDIGS